MTTRRLFCGGSYYNLLSLHGSDDDLDAGSN